MDVVLQFACNALAFIALRICLFREMRRVIQCPPLKFIIIPLDAAPPLRAAWLLAASG